MDARTCMLLIMFWIHNNKVCGDSIGSRRFAWGHPRLTMPRHRLRICSSVSPARQMSCSRSRSRGHRRLHISSSISPDRSCKAQTSYVDAGPDSLVAYFPPQDQVLEAERATSTSGNHSISESDSGAIASCLYNNVQSDYQVAHIPSVNHVLVEKPSAQGSSQRETSTARASWPNLEEEVAIEDELFGSSGEDLSTTFSAPIDQVFELTWNFNGCRRTMWLPNGISFERLRDRIAWKLQKEVTVIRMLARGRVIDLSSTIPNGFSSTVHVVLEQHGGGVVDPQWIASDALAAWSASVFR